MLERVPALVCLSRSIFATFKLSARACGAGGEVSTRGEVIAREVPLVTYLLGTLETGLVAREGLDVTHLLTCQLS